MDYSFDIEHAQKYGVEEAIILKTLIFWSRKNKTNGMNYSQGRYWTYNTPEAWQKWYPFWTMKQIRRILNSLINQGVIITSKLSYGTHNQILWYTVVDQKLLHISDEDALKFTGECPYPAPSESEIKTLIEEADKVNAHFPVYIFLQKITTIKGYPPPPNVIIKACRGYLKCKNHPSRPIKNPWGWFTKVIKAESGAFFADLNIQQAKSWRKTPVADNQDLKDLISGLVDSFKHKNSGGNRVEQYQNR